jgi:hypothetical protein
MGSITLKKSKSVLTPGPPLLEQGEKIANQASCISKSMEA